MAQGNKKKTYPEFLREIGMPTEDIAILGFRFRTESGARCFHFDLMRADIGFVLFDCVGEKSVACVPMKNASKCREIAYILAGEEFSVALML